MKNRIALIIVSFLLPTMVFAAPRTLKVECSPGVTRHQASDAVHIEQKDQTFEFIPVEQEQGLFKRAPSMSFHSGGSWTYPRKNSKFDIQHQYSLENLWPRFDKDGIWLTDKVGISVRMDMLVREIMADGKIKVIGGSQATRIYRFNSKGLVDQYDVALSAEVYSPVLFQLAFDYPNDPPSDANFPHRHFDIDHNQKMREMLKEGTLAQDEYASFGVHCRLSY